MRAHTAGHGGPDGARGGGGCWTLSYFMFQRLTRCVLTHLQIMVDLTTPMAVVDAGPYLNQESETQMQDARKHCRSWWT